MIVNSPENDYGLFVDIEHGMGPKSCYIDISNNTMICSIERKNLSFINSIYNIFSWFMKI